MSKADEHGTGAGHLRHASRGRGDDGAGVEVKTYGEVRVAVRSANKRRKCDYITTAGLSKPGPLVITRFIEAGRVESETHFVVTHAPTGYSAGQRVKGIARARRFLKALLPLTDWDKYTVEQAKTDVSLGKAVTDAWAQSSKNYEKWERCSD